MRGGRYQQKATDDASSRNAEALFETRTVAEIREVETQTRKEIEEKKEELRQLVGASYRDLIESADSILLMRQSCEAVAGNVRKMEAGFESLKTSVAVGAVSTASDRERKRRASLFELGGRVRYLVDTPEKIWGCLDEHMYLEGAERYLRAKEVHSLLIDSAGGELFATFPLLRHHWPLVETFRGQISQRSGDRQQEPGLKVHDYAIALAATGIIDELPSAQMLALFLETRRSWVRAHLRGANAAPWGDQAAPGTARKAEKRGGGGGGRSGETGIAELLRTGEKKMVSGGSGSDSDYVAAMLCRLARMIQASLCHTGVLFLEVSGKTPLLFSTVLAAPPASQLFGGIPNPEREVKLWRMQREKLETSMVPLSAKSIADSCAVWLGKCAADIAAEGKALLRRVSSGTELARVERMVRDDLAEQAALVESLEWLRSAFGGALDSPWDCLCELLLKEPTNLWEVLFESMFVGRMKEVIDSGFGRITIDGALEEILAVERGTLESATSGRRAERRQLNYAGGYRSLGGENLRYASGVESAGSIWKPTVANESDYNSSFFHPDVTRLKDSVEEGLRDVLEDSMCFFQGSHISSRTDELASYVQEQCGHCMTDLVKLLDSKLSSLADSMKAIDSARSAASTEEAGSPNGKIGQSVIGNGKLSDFNAGALQASRTVEKALFLGKFSAALGQHSTYLPIILGSPAQWSARLRIASLKGSAGGLVNGVSLAGRDHGVSHASDRWYPKKGKTAADGDVLPKLKELQRKLRQQSIGAYSIWVAWSAEILTESLSSDLLNDDCLSTSSPLKGWEDTVLKEEEESGGEVEMKLALPAMPSPYAVSFLFSGCQEICRVGGHVLDTAILRLFAWKLCEKVVSVYEKFVSDAAVFNARVSEKGLLQLLFDLRFLSDVLSGGQDVTLASLDHDDRLRDAGQGVGIRSKLSALQSDTSVQALKKSVTTLLSRVLSKLDPIDWATYEPHLWANESRYYQRCAVLFGSLIQLNRLYTETTLKPSPQAHTNTLNMAGSVPRFTYLPISAPIFSVTGGPGTRIPRTLSQDDSIVDPWAGYTNGEDGYRYGSLEAPSQSSIVGARPLIRSFMGQVGSRFGEGLKLGLLSDKSAAAISTFGDMLPMQAAGLFSSLTAGTNKEP